MSGQKGTSHFEEGVHYRERHYRTVFADPPWDYGNKTISSTDMVRYGIGFSVRGPFPPCVIDAHEAHVRKLPPYMTATVEVRDA
jgi:hypothetical protein